MKKVIPFLISCMILLISIPFSGCSRYSGVKSMARKVVAYAKAKDFKSIYTMLDEEDRNAVTADSFYVFCYNNSLVYDSLGRLSFVSSYVTPLQSDSLLVHEVVKRPDFSLLSKIRKDGMALSKRELYKMVESGRAPSVSDTLQMLFIKEHGTYKLSVGFPELARRDSLYDSLSLWLDTTSVHIGRRLVLVTAPDAFPEYSGTVFAVLTNMTHFPMRMVICSLVVGGRDYGDVDFVFDEGKDLQPGQKRAVHVSLPSDVAESIQLKFPRTYLGGHMVQLRPWDIYFPENGQDWTRALDSLVQVSFGKPMLSTPLVISQIAGMSQ